MWGCNCPLQPPTWRLNSNLSKPRNKSTDLPHTHTRTHTHHTHTHTCTCYSLIKGLAFKSFLLQAHHFPLIDPPDSDHIGCFGERHVVPGPLFLQCPLPSLYAPLTFFNTTNSFSAAVRRLISSSYLQQRREAWCWCNSASVPSYPSVKVCRASPSLPP